MNSSFSIKSIDFINSRLGFASSYGGLFKSVDGGTTWQLIFTQPPGYSFITVRFFDANKGYVFQELGSLYKTDNGGVNWTTAIGSTAGDINAIEFANSTTVYAAGDGGTVYRSADDGGSWQPFPTGVHGHTDICFTNSTTGFFVGWWGSIVRTTNGTTLQPYSPTYIDIKPISFPTSTIGFAASWTQLFKTVNAGQSWAPLSLNLNNNLRFQFLHFFSKDTGIAFAHAPLILYKTYDGGQTWQTGTIPLLYKDYIRAFFFVGNTGYINVEGVYGPNLLQTTDRGETWKVQSNQLNGTYQSFFFVDAKTGFAGRGNELWKTVDSAKNWQKQFTSQNIFNSIWFTDAATGYAVGNDGWNFRTKDSGRTWNRFMIAPDNFNFSDVYAIRFFNKKAGYLVGKWGNAWFTGNGGDDWFPNPILPSHLQNLTMTNDSSVYITGDYGTIVKRSLHTFVVDSLLSLDQPSCTVRATARVTTILSSADSVWFEYGIKRYDQQILATPVSVRDTTVKVQALLQGLTKDSTYQLRVRLKYDGRYQYSDSSFFISMSGLPRPTITQSGTQLLSSAASGNQWFLNGTAIPGATASVLTPQTPGMYAVQQTSGNCVSALSAAFNFTTTAIASLYTIPGIRLFPNPVASSLWLENPTQKRLQLVIRDVTGKRVKQLEVAPGLHSYLLSELSAGVYTLHLSEKGKREEMVVKIIKQ